MLLGFWARITSLSLAVPARMKRCPTSILNSPAWRGLHPAEEERQGILRLSGPFWLRLSEAVVSLTCCSFLFVTGQDICLSVSGVFTLGLSLQSIAVFELSFLPFTKTNKKMFKTDG